MGLLIEHGPAAQLLDSTSSWEPGGTGPRAI
jgi:hypothetical protein